MIAQYRTLIWSIIRDTKVPRYVDHDDMYQYGVMGLLEALAKYDPSKSAFITYATYRIRGSILDGVRLMAGYKRSTGPREEVPIEKVIFNLADDVEPADEQLKQHEDVLRLRVAVDKLPKKEKYLITESYFKERDFLEVAQGINIHKTWAYRLRCIAYARLRRLTADHNYAKIEVANPR